MQIVSFREGSEVPDLFHARTKAGYFGTLGIPNSDLGILPRVHCWATPLSLSLILPIVKYVEWRTTFTSLMNANKCMKGNCTENWYITSLSKSAIPLQNKRSIGYNANLSRGVIYYSFHIIHDENIVYLILLEKRIERKPRATVFLFLRIYIYFFFSFPNKTRNLYTCFR